MCWSIRAACTAESDGGGELTESDECEDDDGAGGGTVACIFPPATPFGLTFGWTA